MNKVNRNLYSNLLVFDRPIKEIKNKNKNYRRIKDNTNG